MLQYHILLLARYIDDNNFHTLDDSEQNLSGKYGHCAMTMITPY